MNRAASIDERRVTMMRRSAGVRYLALVFHSRQIRRQCELTILHQPSIWCRSPHIVWITYDARSGASSSVSSCHSISIQTTLNVVYRSLKRLQVLLRTAQQARSSYLDQLTPTCPRTSELVVLGLCLSVKQSGGAWILVTEVKLRRAHHRPRLPPEATGGSHGLKVSKFWKCCANGCPNPNPPPCCPPPLP